MRPSGTLRYAFALALLALLSRAFVPAGWMPTTSPDGTPVFAMCSEGSAASGWVDASGKLHKQGEDAPEDSDQSCAFAGTPAMTLALAPFPAQASPHSPALAAVSVAALAPGRGLAAPPPPATGPPALI